MSTEFLPNTLVVVPSNASKPEGLNLENKKKEDVPWSEAVTLEEWVEQMIRQGKTAIVVSMMNTLPDAKREHYRLVWKRVREDMKK